MNISNFVTAGLSILVLVVVLLLSSENQILKSNLESCSADLTQEKVSKALSDGFLKEQNNRIDQSGETTKQMRQNQNAALADAEKEIAELESQIELIRSWPPAADCEAVRVQMIQNVVQI